MESPATQPNVFANLNRPVPRANTGSRVKDAISDVLMRLVQVERRFDPLMRPLFDAALRDPIARLVTALMNTRRTDEHVAPAEEKLLLGEEAFNQDVIATFRKQMAGLWQPSRYERGGNTKTHGIVRGEFVVHGDLPAHLAKGIFATPHRYPAFVRFSGPGPYITPDIDDVGFMSLSVKLMEVPGPKLLDEERGTQDFLTVCTPTFVTPDIRANAHLQRASLQNASIFHFLNFSQPHVLDLIMQGLWTKTQSSPLEAPYFSCVPYLLGDGQAMQYSFWPIYQRRTPVPQLPRRPPDDYLRLALQQTLAQEDVSIEMRVQVQTDSFRMPIENNGVLWPESLSPRVPVATLRLPRQMVKHATSLQLARRLSFNPWHCIAEHRPLGSQSRARKLMYTTLADLRLRMNAIPHWEPTPGDLP